MTDPSPHAHLAHLQGDALDAALAQGFTVADETVRIGEGAQSRDVVLRKPQNADHLISEADYVMDERLPYWADLWPSSRVLATALLAEDGAGRRLLEMGCGLGLDTVAAMCAGFDVTSTDYYEQAIHMTRANAARNLGREPAVRMVNWRQWPEDLGQFDVVIAADVLYEKEYAILVAECLARALAPHGEAIIADPGRLALPDFRAQLPLVGLTLAQTTTVPYEDTVVKQQVQLMRIRHVAR
jgi:ETFB lysine methyltransferase